MSLRALELVAGGLKKFEHESEFWGNVFLVSVQLALCLESETWFLKQITLKLGPLFSQLLQKEGDVRTCLSLGSCRRRLMSGHV